MTKTNGDRYYATLYGREIEMLKTSTELAVWFAIKSFSGNGVCFASTRQIAKRAHVAQDTTLRAIQAIEAAGLVKNHGLQKPPSGLWKTYRLEVNDSRSEVNGGRTQVNDTAVEVNDSTDMKDKGKKNNTITNVVTSVTKSEINPLIGKFSRVNPSYRLLYSNKSQRAALDRLVRENGLDRITEVIQHLPETNAMPYAPTITTPLELEKSLGRLLAFLQKETAKRKEGTYGDNKRGIDASGV